MAVSLNEAWNDFIEEPRIERNEVQTKVIEKPTQPSVSVSAKVSKDDLILQLGNANKEVYKSMKENNELLQSMVDQLNELRREETKRSTIYIIMGAILFACLFMYIDKLQHNIKSLTISRQNRVVSRPEHMIQSQSSESFPWFALN